MNRAVGPHVLIVEDDEGIALLESRTLERAGYRTSIASSVDEARRLIAVDFPDAMLLDFSLPGGITGLDFYGEAKTATPIPVILVTGYGDQRTIIEALRAGVRDFVLKTPEFLAYLPEAMGRVVKQVQVERQLAHSEARLAAIIDSSMDAILTVTDEHRIRTLNAAGEDMLGCPADDAVGLPVATFLPHLLSSPRLAASTSGVTEMPAGRRRELTARRANGQEFPVEASISHTSALGEGFFTILLRDTTERKALERRLRTEREFVKAVLDHLEAAVFATDAHGKLTFSNKAAERLRHGSPAARDADVVDAWPLLRPDRPTPLSRAEHPLSRALRGEAFRNEEAAIAPDGGPARRLFVSGQAIGDAASVQGAVVVLHDVTEHQQLQEQLRQSQKLEAVGTLAGGIAHDFNNLLTVIEGYVEMLIRDASTESQRADLEEVRRAALRASALTKQILSFSRRQVVTPESLDLASVVVDMERLLRRLIGENIEIVTAVASGTASIRADRNQAEQVLLNLAVNARDAMPAGGRLTIETRDVELDEEYCVQHPDVTPGRYVLLAVSDTGVGMTSETRSRIFEPFFTTKTPGKGTGLGLSTVYGIVRQAGGGIHVYSEPGLGSVFRVYFPSLADAAPSSSGRFAAAAPGGSETILLVEDEEALRGLAARVLRGRGYAVLTARDGRDALSVLEAEPGKRIDLLLTDAIMPGLGGFELAARVRALQPTARVLFVSGYTDDTVRSNGLVAAGASFLQKPFSPDALAAKVREVLDRDPAASSRAAERLSG